MIYTNNRIQRAARGTGSSLNHMVSGRGHGGRDGSSEGTFEDLNGL